MTERGQLSRWPEFPSWRAKLLRAHDHLNWLRSELEWLQKSGRYHIRVDYEEDTDENIVYIHSIPDVSHQWNLVLGDCVANYRHALDHIVWRLGEIALKKEPPTTTEFPIFIDPDLYVRDFNRKIGCLGPDIQTLIERMQPYHTGYEPLWPLHELARRDKHRTLTLSTSVLKGAYFTVSGQRVDLNITAPRGGLELGAEFGRIVGAELVALDPEMKMNFHLPLDVFVKEGGGLPTTPVIPLLTEIGQTVTSVVDALAIHLA